MASTLLGSSFLDLAVGRLRVFDRVTHLVKDVYAGNHKIPLYLKELPALVYICIGWSFHTSLETCPTAIL